MLYLTIDVPVPSDHWYIHRNQNDPALLPYSYTLSSKPNFLLENADSPMTKWFSIPSTPQNPYRALPISFPDLAAYLAEALEDSRRAMADRTSGHHRLAKAVDTFYPMRGGRDSVEDDDEIGGRGRPRLGQRMLGLFSRGQRSTNRVNNDDRFDLVTPFYADEHGR